MKQRQRGTSLVEISFTLFIISLICLIGFSTGGISKPTARAIQTAETLQQVIQFARTSAVLYGQVVTICPQTESLTCGENWANGILVYRNPQGTVKPAKEYILRTIMGYPREYKLYLNAFANNYALDFQPGGAAIFQNGRFYYSSMASDITWQLLVNRAGRTRLVEKHLTI